MPSTALNEGRELIPGDTPGFTLSRYNAFSAQRRPGAYPRRHRVTSGEGSDVEARSTKAGSLSPATRRFGCRPRCRCRTLNEGRELIPGDTRRVLPPQPFPCERSTKAGSLSPATHARDIAQSTTADHAQRRPGAYPRRHGLADGPARGQQIARSTKAGSLSPATRPKAAKIATGLETAQRRPGAYPRRHGRVPAAAVLRRRPLNEGRELIPGDTSRNIQTTASPSIAQRRPGAYPRRHAATSCTRGRCASSLNEGRELIPGDTCEGRRSC